MRPLNALLSAVYMLLVASPSPAADGSFDAPTAFGARQSVEHLALSPDGKTIAYVAPTTGQGSILYTLSLTEKDAKSHRALLMNGDPSRIGRCEWVSDDRIVCAIYGGVKDQGSILPFTRILSVNSDGSNLQMLSTPSSYVVRGYLLNGGDVVDWLPDENGAILMARVYGGGLAVDHIDTRTTKYDMVQNSKAKAFEYLSDGHGTLRIIGFVAPRGASGQDNGELVFHYRTPGSPEWRRLCTYNRVDHTGFLPMRVDRDLNIVYGIQRKDGRDAVFSVKLSEMPKEELVYANSEVDVANLIVIGRRHRVVGVSYATEKFNTVYFDSELQKLTTSLSAALPDHPSVWITDSNLDETQFLVFASRDNYPGGYYLYDKASHHLQPLFAVREELDGVQLALVRPMSYAAGDGTKIPGYITYPPGKESAKGLPAIVMPHGGPGSRDVWGFDWLGQFYANRGFVVLQPNFRGSTGYGEDWYLNNGFRSWPTAIGDVLDAGRWLVSQGIADASKLAIVGWSYGGYAALQSAVTDPGVFKAVIAIAPVTDLRELKDAARNYTNYDLITKFVGGGLGEASPAENASRIKVPVMLFHGTMDRNVAVNESRHMDRSLAAANVPHELVTFEGLDHQLDDSKAREEMLRKSEAFLRKALNL